MLTYPNIDPVAIAIGPLKIHWYGIMYLIGFASAWALGVYRSKKSHSTVATEQVSDIIFYGALGVIIGGRLGYMLFYNFTALTANPLSLFQIWDGGMSFHGGFIGVIIATSIYAYVKKLNVIDIFDFFAPMIPIGLGAGRLGNFINDELWGRVTDSPLGMVFPSGGPLPRYPSQLFELILEGIVLFIILWLLSMKPRQRGWISAQFLLWYGIFRFFCEHFRQPDPQMGYVLFNWMTMGQLLSLPMILAGILMLTYLAVQKRKDKTPCNNI